MSQIVLDAIAADIATLTREVVPPTGELGYGTDLSCVSELTETLEEVDSTSPLGIAQACIRRLTCPRGRLPDDPDYGLDIRGLLNVGITQQKARDLAGQIRLELLKDDRIERCTVTLQLVSTSRLTISIRIWPFEREQGDFSLILAVTNAEVILEAIQ